MAGFPSTHEEDSHIHAEVIWLGQSKTLAIDSWLVVWDGPRNLVFVTEGDGTILQRL